MLGETVLLAMLLLGLVVGGGGDARAQTHPPECFSVVHVTVEDVDIDGGGVPVYKRVWDRRRFESVDEAREHMKRLAVEGVWDAFGETFYPPTRIIRLVIRRDCV